MHVDEVRDQLGFVKSEVFSTRLHEDEAREVTALANELKVKRGTTLKLFVQFCMEHQEEFKAWRASRGL